MRTASRTYREVYFQPCEAVLIIKKHQLNVTEVRTWPLNNRKTRMRLSYFKRDFKAKN